MPSSSSYPTGRAYSYVVARRRTKADWAGVTMGDAFKPQVDHLLRRAARRSFHRRVREAQKRAAARLGHKAGEGFRPKAKTSLSPCYTSYPPALAVRAAVGLNAFLEFQARSKRGSRHLLQDLASQLRAIYRRWEGRIEPLVLKQVEDLVAEAVLGRVYLEDLARGGGLPEVEAYRLYAACQQSLRFTSLAEVINASVLFADLLPPLESLRLHPLTRRIMASLADCCRVHAQELATVRPEEMWDLARRWARAVMQRLTRFLPPPRPRQDDPHQAAEAAEPDPEAAAPLSRIPETRQGGAPPLRLPPLDQPVLPRLEPPSEAGDIVRQALQTQGNSGSQRLTESDAAESGGADSAEERWEVVRRFEKALRWAGRQQDSWEDMRSELVERQACLEPLQGGPITGMPTDGHEVTLELAGGKEVSGEIFERPLEPGHDPEALAALERQAMPITRQLRRNLYPDLEETSRQLRLRTSGSLDGRRLALAEFSSTVFRRFQTETLPDRRGRPVLAIACDGSGSLKQPHMKMLKLLVAAWLRAAAGTEVVLTAALYHGGLIRPGVTGPLVQWVHHPWKTPARGMQESLMAVAGLPDEGSGVQADALSLGFILEDARRLARGGSIYLTVISDTAWNICLHRGVTGQQEVRELLDQSRRRLGGKLHTTLVALGTAKPTGLEASTDKVIGVEQKELADPGAVAARVGSYVSSCLKQRRRVLENW